MAVEFLLKVLISFVLLGSLFFGILWFLKKKGMIPAFLANGAENGKIKVVSSLRLTPKTYLFLIDVEGKRILLGVSENGVSYLHDFDIQNNFDFSNANTAEISRLRMISR